LNAQTYTVNPKTSSLQWHGKKVTGEHFGFISLKEGNMTMSKDQITGGKFIIDMNSITNSDIKDPGYNTKLVNHLKSDDFFGAAKYPVAVLELVNSTPFKDNEAAVEGKLTIKNITHPVSFTVKRAGSIYSAMIVVDRSKYDVRYGSGSFFEGLGDNMIYDEFKMTVSISVMDSSQASR
jgi:polyisoprenoid-binding protein YceI